MLTGRHAPDNDIRCSRRVWDPPETGCHRQIPGRRGGMLPDEQLVAASLRVPRAADAAGCAPV